MSTTLDHKSKTWPPPYEVRYSKRAKNIQLKIHPNKGLEVVIPIFRKRFNITNLLEEKRAWIERNLPLITAQQQAIKSTATQLPHTINLTAINEIWHNVYVPNSNYNLKLTVLNATKSPPLLPSTMGQSNNSQRKNILLLSGQIEPSLVQSSLITWLKQYAKKHLALQLHDLSSLTRLKFQKLCIRGQKTLWGSCNTQHHINLNFKLLFLPPALVKHVLLHELCHTKYLNHSHKFWDLVAKFDAKYKAHDKALRSGDQYVPEWILNF